MADPDLSDDLFSDDEEDDETNEENDTEHKEADDGNWTWSSGRGPDPHFDVNNVIEGKPSALPLNCSTMSPLNFFYQVVPMALIRKAVDETNKYAAQKLENASPEAKANWKPVVEGDIFRFLAVLYAMGIVRVHRKKQLWPTSNPEVIKYPSVTHVMSYRRFRQIKRFFHLEDNTLAAPAGTQEYDPLYKIRKLYDTLQARFRACWKLGTFASLDESMTNWRGRSRFKQYMRSKPIRWGIQICLYL